MPGCNARSVARGRCALHPRQDLVGGRARPSASAKGYGVAWRRIRAAYLAKYPACFVCGYEDKSNHVDHILPRDKGGSDDESNLQTLCATHHSQKTVMVDGGFGNKPR